MPDRLLPPDLVRLPTFVPGMRIGLFGGSFDPPHAGHLMVSLVALRAIGLDQVWWLVSPRNPLKSHAPSQDLARRVGAARAFLRHPHIHVTGVEAALGTNYTAETLACLLPSLSGAEPVWMMGADNLANFHKWRHWQAIAAMLPLAIFNRPSLALAALASPAAHALRRYRLPERAAADLPTTTAPAWVFLSKPLIPLSSTALRAERSRQKAS